MRVVVVTGISGSGKSVALRALEDAGYYAIDNLPMVLFDKLLELSQSSIEIEKLALGVDTRDASHLQLMPARLEAARSQGHDVDIIFLDATDDALDRRFSETRRRHPLAHNITVKEAIARERALLEPLRNVAKKIVDTSTMSTHELKREMQRLVSDAGGVVAMGVTVMSFGFRHGIPAEADMVLDVRFLPNPHFVDALRPLTGEDEACAAYVMERPETQAFLTHLFPLLGFLLPQYEQEGKAYLTIAVGCTGGQHRSVALARRIADWVREHGREVRLRHRDMRGAAVLRGVTEELPPNKAP